MNIVDITARRDYWVIKAEDAKRDLEITPNDPDLPELLWYYEHQVRMFDAYIRKLTRIVQYGRSDVVFDMPGSGELDPT